jgi:hypothetical protein
MEIRKQTQKLTVDFTMAIASSFTKRINNIHLSTPSIILLLILDRLKGK